MQAGPLPAGIDRPDVEPPGILDRALGVLEDQRLVIVGQREGWPTGATLPGASELMVKILSKVVDDFEINAGDGNVSFRAVKQASPQDTAK